MRSSRSLTWSFAASTAELCAACAQRSMLVASRWVQPLAMSSVRRPLSLPLTNHGSAPTTERTYTSRMAVLQLLVSSQSSAEVASSSVSRASQLWKVRSGDEVTDVPLHSDVEPQLQPNRGFANDQQRANCSEPRRGLLS
jgi:hypothetical protein